MSAPAPARLRGSGWELVEHALVKLPRPMFVGVGQGVERRGTSGQAQVAKLAFTGGQPAANLAQRLRTCQLAERHGHELAPAGEAAGVSLGLVLAHRGLKLGTRKQMQHLTENAGYSNHGDGGTPLGLCLSTHNRSRTLPPPLKSLIWTIVTLFASIWSWRAGKPRAFAAHFGHHDSWDVHASCNRRQAQRTGQGCGAFRRRPATRARRYSSIGNWTLNGPTTL